MKIDVLHIAKLAKLPITPKEKTKYGKQLSETIEHVDGLNKINTKNVEPVSQVTGLENITREDKISPSLSQKEALSGAKSTHNGFFKVDGIFNED